MSDLTKNIDGVGVPMIELANIYMQDDWRLGENGYCVSSEYGFEFGYKDECFTVTDFAMEYLPINQEALFQWLDANHFLRGVDESLIKYIE